MLVVSIKKFTTVTTKKLTTLRRGLIVVLLLKSSISIHLCGRATIPKIIAMNTYISNNNRSLVVEVVESGDKLF